MKIALYISAFTLAFGGFALPAAIAQQGVSDQGGGTIIDAQTGTETATQVPDNSGIDSSGNVIDNNNNAIIDSNGNPIPQATVPAASSSVSPSSNFVPLAPIPGLTTGGITGPSGFATFFNQLYKYLIGLAAVLAVIEIIIAGFEISTKDSVPMKMKGKERIYHAILGLVLVLSPALVFGIINPSILNLSVNIPAIDLTAPPITTGGAQITPGSQTNCGLGGASQCVQNQEDQCTAAGGSPRLTTESGSAVVVCDRQTIIPIGTTINDEAACRALTSGSTNGTLRSQPQPVPGSVFKDCATMSAANQAPQNFGAGFDSCANIKGGGICLFAK